VEFKLYSIAHFAVLIADPTGIFKNSVGRGTMGTDRKVRPVDCVVTQPPSFCHPIVTGQSLLDCRG